MKNITKTLAIIVTIVFLSACSKYLKFEATAVQNFEKEKYLGKWYEIARLDHSFERNLNNVTAEYSVREDGLLKVKNRGFNTKKEKWEDAEGRAKFEGAENVGALKVSFFGPFFGAYNIISIDEDYKYALVIGDSYGFMWILSREKTIPNYIREKYITKAQEIGYDTNFLIWVAHDM